MIEQQLAAMRMALEALETLKKAINDEDGWVLNAEKTIKNLENLIADEWYENLLWGEALAQPQNHSEQHLNIGQGEPIGWTAARNLVDDGYGHSFTVISSEPSSPNELYVPVYVTPPVVPQGETKYWTYMVNNTWRKIKTECPPDDAYDEGTLEPLYTTPPSVEAAIKATKERAAKVCEECFAEYANNRGLMLVAYKCAEAIRSMK